MGCFDCLERAFFRLYPSKRKETTNEFGHWLRCVMLIATILHFGMALFCMALVGFTAMILNFLQCMWSYSVFLTLREREMVLYLLALLAQLAQSFCFLFRGDEKPTGAFQTGGTIGNIVGCSIMLFVGARALWKFHETGGLHGTGGDLKSDLTVPLINEEADDTVLGDEESKKASDKEKKEAKKQK